MLHVRSMTHERFAGVDVRKLLISGCLSAKLLKINYLSLVETKSESPGLSRGFLIAFFILTN